MHDYHWNEKNVGYLLGYETATKKRNMWSVVVKGDTGYYLVALWIFELLGVARLFNRGFDINVLHACISPNSSI